MILRWALCENGCGTGSGSLRSGGGVVTIAIRSRYRRLGSTITFPLLLGWVILRWALGENGSGSLRSGGGVVTIAIRSRYRRLGSMISRLPFLLGRLVRTSRFSGPWT